MGSLGPSHLIALLLAVAIIAAIGGFITSAVTRRNKRRARGFFLLGFLCGWMAGSILRGRRRGLNGLGALARCVDVCPPRARIRHDTGRSLLARSLLRHHMFDRQYSDQDSDQLFCCGAAEVAP